jgi:hypothetical protein
MKTAKTDISRPDPFLLSLLPDLTPSSLSSFLGGE